jgi:hypothetical protein
VLAGLVLILVFPVLVIFGPFLLTGAIRFLNRVVWPDQPIVLANSLRSTVDDDAISENRQALAGISQVGIPVLLGVAFFGLSWLAEVLLGKDLQRFLWPVLLIISVALTSLPLAVLIGIILRISILRALAIETLLVSSAVVAIATLFGIVILIDR